MDWQGQAVQTPLQTYRCLFPDPYSCPCRHPLRFANLGSRHVRFRGCLRDHLPVRHSAHRCEGHHDLHRRWNHHRCVRFRGCLRDHLHARHSVHRCAGRHDRHPRWNRRRCVRFHGCLRDRLHARHSAHQCAGRHDLHRRWNRHRCVRFRAHAAQAPALRLVLVLLHHQGHPHRVLSPMRYWLCRHYSHHSLSEEVLLRHR